MDLTENEIKRSLRQRSKRRKGGDDVSEELVKLEKEVNLQILTSHEMKNRETRMKLNTFKLYFVLQETRDGEKPEKEARPHESSVGEKQSENVVISGPGMKLLRAALFAFFCRNLLLCKQSFFSDNCTFRCPSDCRSVVD